MVRKFVLFQFVFVLQLASSWSQEVQLKPSPVNWEKVEEAWSGAAELNHYELKQARYGEIRKGDAMLIFVREPFLKEQHVKDESGRGEFQVLKMNATRDFLTGVYPYHTLVSVFQPLEKGSTGKALKVTTSVQEWCGHVFMQTNRRDGTLKTEVNSYFEREEGTSFSSPASVFLEDEIWTGLRVAPSALPVGDIKMVPGSLWLRFSHQEPKPQAAKAVWKKGSRADTLIYEISYLKTQRVLAIEIQREVPFGIESWKESSSKGLLSEGKLTHREVNVDYWNYSQEAEGKRLRSKIGL